MAKKTREQLEMEELQKLIDTQDDDIDFISKDAYHRDQDRHGEYSDYPAIPESSDGGMSSGVTEADLVGDTYAGSANMDYSTQLEIERAESREQVESISGSVPGREDLSIGGMTPFDVQLSRFSHVEAGIALRAAEFLNDPMSQDAIYGGLLGSQKKENQTLLDVRDAFGSVIGKENVNRFVGELRKLADETTVPSTGRQHLKTSYSMLGKTAMDYSEHGSSIYASDRNQEQADKREVREEEAYATARSFATKYVDPSLPEKHREKAIEDNYNFIIKRAMEDKTAPRNVIGYDGQQLYTTEEQVPQNIRNVGGYTAADVITTRKVTASGAMPLPSEMPGLGNLPQYNDWSPKKSFAVAGVYGNGDADEAYKKDLEQFKGMARTIKQATVTLSDEFHGNTERYTRQGNTQLSDWQKKQDFINEAALLDIDRDSSDVSHSQEYQKYLLEGGGKGSSTGGMYGEKGQSRADLYIEARGKGYSEEDAVLASEGFLLGRPDVATPDEEIYAFAQTGATDREKYLKRIELNKPPEQRSIEWHKMRAGKQTGSAMLSPYAREDTIDARARELASGEVKKTGTSKAMAEGVANEPLVDIALAEFLTGKIAPEDIEINKFSSIGQKPKMHEKVITEEAYFETSPEHEGFGVSPDAYVFTGEGESLELAEYKYRTSLETLHSMPKKDMYQMQMQMAVTKKKGVHYMRMHKDKKTGKMSYAYDYVTPNKELLNKLIKTNQKALDKAELYKKGGTMAISQAEIESAGAGSATTFQEQVRLEEEATTFETQADASQSRVDNWVKGGKGTGPTGKMADYEAMFDAIEEADLAEVNAEAAKAAKEKAAADKEGARASKEFKNSLSTAGRAATNLVGIFASLGKEGLDSGMTDIRLAAKAGMSSNETRNMRFALEAQGGLSSDESAQVVMQAGKLAASFNDPTQGVGAYKDMESSLRAAGLGSLGSYENMRGKNPAEMLAYHQDKMNSFTDPEKRATYGVITGMSNLAVSAGANNQVTGGDLLNIKDKVDEVGLRSAQEGYMDIDQWEQKKKEQGAALAGGEVIRAGESLSTVAAVGKNTLALGALTTALGINTAMLAKGGGGGADVVTKAAKGGGAMGLIAKAAKWGGAAVAGLGLMLHSEDLGGGLDTIEGAMAEKEKGNYLDKLAPVVNVAPSKNIGNVKATTAKTNDGMTSNVEVNVEVNKDEVVTKVDNNGAIEMYTEEQDSGQY